MGSEMWLFIMIPVLVMIVFTLMFGSVDATSNGGVSIGNNTLVGQDISLLTTLLGSASDRGTCESNFSQCSNTDCFIVDPDGVFGSANGFPCGDTFYVVLVIGTIISTPVLAIAVPVLIMVPPLTIQFFNQSYDLKDFWFIYAPLWGMFGLGISRIIW
jgi:hypothetical protein